MQDKTTQISSGGLA